MNDRPTIREQIDSCRVGSDDLHLPELAELARAVSEDPAVRAQFEKSQSSDRALATAMHDVPIPAGLEARLLAAMSAASASSSSLASTVERVVASAGESAIQSDKDTLEKPVPAPTTTAWPVSRRVLLMFSGVAAAALIIGLIGPGFFPKSPGTVSKEELATRTNAWLTEAAGNPWKGAVAAMPKANYPTASLARSVKTAGWMAFTSNDGTAITAYRLTLGGKSATLLVIPTNASYSVATSPSTSLPGITGARNVGAWQRGGVLYILSVQDGRPDEFAPRQDVG